MGLGLVVANGGHISISCATVGAGVLELLALSFTAAVYACVTVFLVCQSVEMFLAIEL